jgi:2-aminoadipate transaminase
VGGLPGGHRRRALLDAATERGVTFVKGSDFYPPRQGGESSARLAFSFVSPDEIRAGVAMLAALLRELRTPPVAV